MEHITDSDYRHNLELLQQHDNDVIMSFACKLIEAFFLTNDSEMD